MPQALRRSETSSVARAQAKCLRRDRLIAVLARRRRRQVARIAALCTSWMLVTGVTGAYLAIDETGAPIETASAALDLRPAQGPAVAPAQEPAGHEHVDQDRVGQERLVARIPIEPHRHGDGQVRRGTNADPSTERLLRDRASALATLHDEPLMTDPAPRADAPAVLRRVAATQIAMLRQPPLPDPKPPAWRRNAVPVSVPAGQPMIAIVLDDLGLDRAASRRAIDLPGPLTLAFLTYANGLERFAARARAAGHELLLHVPMEPIGHDDPGPQVLETGLDRQELRRRIDWGLGRFSGFVGINNHMGSKFTASAEDMAMVMRELRDRGLLFLDSLTTSKSVGVTLAQRAGVPYARRDVFIDNDWNDRESIRRQLDRLEATARRWGHAVGIGHPHRATLDVLAEWIPLARERGIALVPISAVVRHSTDVAQKRNASAG